MRTADFDYELPAELIAQAPLPERADSRLLVLQREGLVDSRMREFPRWLDADDLLVFNNTRVVRARLQGRKEGTGGHVEILVERVLDERRALVMLRASKTPKPGTRILVEQYPLQVQGRQQEFFELDSPAIDWAALMEERGEIPLPPYIERRATQDDAERYQSLLAREDGAVAAPTASLHFDQDLLRAARERVAELATITLHVGAGTFQRVRVESVESHQMHAERYRVDDALVEAVDRTRARGGRVVAVGTTVVRALESAAQEGSLSARAGDSRLFITPGYRFRVVDALLTNFHLPQSTLLMLVSAFAGQARIREAYAHAVRERYRFFSYGDAMFLPGHLPE